MKLSAKETAFFDFVKRCHGDQKRKYTGEPYWHHLLSVAAIAEPYVNRVLICVALAHDLFEDTKCTETECFNELVSCGYDQIDAQNIIYGIKSLTDEYTKEKYPQFNRKERKWFECVRLSNIATPFQTIKYADLIDNTSSIVAHDPGFAKVYLDEKKAILARMRCGDINLLIDCCHTLKEASKSIQIA